MNLVQWIASRFERKSAADRVMEQWKADLDAAGAQARSCDDAGLIAMIRERRGQPLHVLQAASQLASRGRLDLIATLFAGDAAEQRAGVDAACLAACNGREGAVELLSELPQRPEAELRLRAVASLVMVADGTPSDLGSSTKAIRAAARALLERFAADPDNRVCRAAENGLQESRDVDDVRRGPGQLLYLGRRAAEELLGALDRLKN